MLKAKAREEKIQRMRNDITEIRTVKKLEKVDLNFDSPRMKKAMNMLGISLEEVKKKDRSEFEDRAKDENVVSLRFKHF
jgi:hypothetical protein